MNTTRKRMIGALVGFVVVMVVAVVAYGRLSLSVSPSSPSQTETSSSSTSQTKTIPAPDFSFTVGRLDAQLCIISGQANRSRFVGIVVSLVQGRTRRNPRDVC